MSGEGKGRGRGLSLLMNMRKAKAEEAVNVTPDIGSSVALMTAPPVAGGRGRALMLLNKSRTTTPPGGTSAASSAAPSSVGAVPSPPSTTVGSGRGALRLLQNLKPQSEPVETAESDIRKVAESFRSTNISEPVGKNKYFREIKDTPPVVQLGSSGHQISLTANYIKLNVKPGMGVYEYEVRYNPPQDYKGMCIMMLNMHKNVIGNTKTFDGTTLYLPKKLPGEETILTSKHPSEDIDVEVKIIFRRTRRMSEVRHLYNVLFNNIMKELELVRFGKQFFDPKAPHQIPQHKLQVWPGYVTSVDEFEGGLMLSVDSSHRVLRTQTALSLIRDIVDRDKVNWKNEVTKAIIGASVLTDYNNKTYRIDDIADNMTPLSTFDMNDGNKISFVDYYKTHYQIKILDVYQPLLISRKTKRVSGSEKPVDYNICLVPELCKLTGLTDEMRSNFRLMKDIATYTRITPNQRIYALKKYVENINSNENAKHLLLNWGLSLSPETVRLNGRTLDMEKVTFGNGAGICSAEWNRDISRHPVIQAVNINNWTILYTKRDHQCTQEFVDCMKRCGPPMGIQVSQPQMVLLPSERTDVYASHLRQHYDDTTQLVVCICPSSRDDRYAAIKRICCSDNPVPSQVINARTLMNRDKQRNIVQKIALQINCKLGGTLWSIAIPFKNAMVVGVDSYHEAGRRSKSVCGFVASYNQSFTHWYSRVCFQNPGQEIVDGLKTCFTEALKFYFNTNGEFPNKIIIYRDGVGDGQLNTVSDYEVEQLKSCFAMVSGSEYSPALTVVVVQKRINTRIFTVNGSNCENPPPGTILDHMVTRRDWYDFFVISQKVNQGSVTPSHYIVVHNSSTMSPDQIQKLTYKLCHLYYNWPGTVRVPAPCQYAHKLAFLVGQSMHKEHSELLADRLFFL